MKNHSPSRTSPIENGRPRYATGEGATVDNITTLNNAWGSMAIYCSSSSYLNRGSSGINIDGTTCSFGEGTVFTQDEFGLTNTGVVIAGYNDGFPATAPVGTFGNNALGLKDVGGNVAEWVHDLYGVYPPSQSVATDPRGAASGRFHVIRGSSWMHSGITELRMSFRDYGDKARPDLGFRIARSLE